MKKLVVLTGAGISAESGVKTFRDNDGLWENHDVMEVASPHGWRKNKELVLRFYNERRKQLNEVQPNEAHKILAELETYFEIVIITQNVDDLHERAGSTHIIHLHGELKKSRSVKNPETIFDQEGDIILGDLAPDGRQLRPHIVWFGEDVPLIPKAAQIVQTANILLVIGTSMQVYPAAGLVEYTSEDCEIIVVNPEEVEFAFRPKTKFIQKKAVAGMHEVRELLKPTSKI